MNDGAYEIEKEVGRLLTEGKQTLAAAESCTGGLVGHRVTSVSGSSVYFLGGVIAYSDDVKAGALGVSREALSNEGAVSEAVAQQMALGVKDRFGADIGLGVTGIAGPGGGTAEKPVGLVFIALANGKMCKARRFRFSGDRTAIKTSISQAALEMLRDSLLKKERVERTWKGGRDG